MELLADLDRHQRWLEQHDGMHDVRGVERELQAEAAAGGMTDDVRPLNAEMTHQGAKCRRFALERQRPASRPLPAYPARWYRIRR